MLVWSRSRSGFGRALLLGCPSDVVRSLLFAVEEKWLNL